MKLPSGPKDVSKELAHLEFPSKQNRELPKLPSNTTIHKRPINHAPIASPYAGPKVQKIVYVSRKTPVMSAVKRVKKFLREIEKRALQREGVNGILDRRNGQQELYRKLEQVSEKLQAEAEEVLVKASGRAMEQALRIAQWFKDKEQEITCNVVVRTGSVSVIDDIIEKDLDAGNADLLEAETDGNVNDQTTIEVGDTTMELFRHLDGEPDGSLRKVEGQDRNAEEGKVNVIESDEDEGASHPKGKRKRKRKRKEYDADDVPEARIRWVKTIEVAISLRS